MEIYDLPCTCGVALGELTQAISLDKKNLNNHLNVVLLKKIGESYVHPTDISFFGESERVL